MPSEFEIEPSGDVPDFSFDGVDEDEVAYASIFLLGLSSLYQKYRGKPPDFAIKNLSNDVAKLQKKMLKQVDTLETVFDDTVTSTLTEKGILESKVVQANIKSSIIRHGLAEQKSTVKGIATQLERGIISKAHHLISRASEKIFDVASNFRSAVSRTKKMVKTGYRDTKARAEREGKVFLYGDPLSDWVTAGDSDVCEYCIAVEEASPMPLSKMPLGPLHPHCGERCEIKNHDEDNLELTQAAMELTMYDI